MNIKKIYLVVAVFLVAITLSACDKKSGITEFSQTMGDKKIEKNTEKQKDEISEIVNEVVAEKTTTKTEYEKNRLLAVDEEIQKVKEQNIEKKLTLVLLNQYGNPFNLFLSKCGTVSKCSPKLYDALGEEISGSFRAKIMGERRSNFGLDKNITKDDDDGYIYQFSKSLPAGTYTVKIDLQHNQIGPTEHWSHQKYYNYNIRYSVARYYDNLHIEKTFTISENEDEVIKIEVNQNKIAYQYWAVCGQFQNELGTALKMEYKKCKSSIKSNGKLITASAIVKNEHGMSYKTSAQFDNLKISTDNQNDYGACIKSNDGYPNKIQNLLPGKYEWHVKRDGYKEIVIPFEFLDVSEWSDDKVREEGVSFIDVGVIKLEKE